MKALKWLQIAIVCVGALVLCWDAIPNLGRPALAQVAAPGYHGDANSLQGQPLASIVPQPSPTKGQQLQQLCVTQSGAGLQLQPCVGLANCSPNALVGTVNPQGDCLPFSYTQVGFGNPNGAQACLRQGDAWIDLTSHQQWICTASGSVATAVWITLASAGTPSVTPTPSPTPSPTNTPTATPTSTATPVAGPGSSINPALQPSPIDPTVAPYFCDKTGGADDTNCLNSAIQAGDVLLPAGTYKVIGEVSIPSNRNFQCVSPATVTINNPNGQSVGVSTIHFKSVNHSSFANCTILGTNTASPPNYSANFLYNWLVRIDEAGTGTGGQNTNNITVVNNVMKFAWGQATVEEYAAASQGPPTNITISSNDMEQCGYYGPIFDNTTNSSMDKNIIKNCSIGNEEDCNASQVATNQTHNGNQVTMTTGSGCAQPGIVGCGSGIKDFIGSGAGCNNVIAYTSNVFNNNTVVKADIVLNIGSPPPTGSGNSCTGGCVAH